MHLLIDACPLQTLARDRGMGRYTVGLLGGLRRARPDWRIEVVEHARLTAIPPELLGRLPVVRFDAPFAYDPANTPANDRYYADWLLARRPGHVLLTGLFERPGVVPRFAGWRVPTSAILYDLIPLLFPQQYGAWHGLLGHGHPWYARRVRDACRLDTLFAISAATAADARRLLGAICPPVHNIRGAVDERLARLPDDQLPAAAERVTAKFGITGPFLLYVGGEDYRKNLTGAIAGFAALPRSVRDTHQLVIACFLTDRLTGSPQQAIDRLGVGGRVVAIGHVTDAELTVLYQSCRAVFFPSLYEGLGLPVLEALTCGAPVACSGTSSLPEFAGGVAWLFDPRDPGSMADALVRCLDEPRDERRREREAFARTFTWAKTAEAVARGIETAGRAGRPPRTRLAWVSAGRPDSLGVLDRLADTWDVELVLPSRDGCDDLAARFLLLDPNELDSRHEAAPFDVVVVEVGVGGPDAAAVAIAVRHRGMVVLSHPDPAAYRWGAELDRVLASTAGVLVGSPDVYRWTKARTDGPVVLFPGGLDDGRTAAWLAAVLRETAARLALSDRRWLETTANALASVGEPIPPELIDRWAALRVA
jgi:glycosyltransferase involved in cell wall biosynthesis